MGAPKEKITLAMVVWLIRGGGLNILFDSGYHRGTFLKDHPLSRARWVLNHLERTVAIDEAVKRRPAFVWRDKPS